MITLAQQCTALEQRIATAKQKHKLRADLVARLIDTRRRQLARETGYRRRPTRQIQRRNQEPQS